MKMNTDREWLRRMAEKEDGCEVSVGGLIGDMKGAAMLELKDGEKVVVTTNVQKSDMTAYMFTAGTVEGYARKYRKDPAALLEECRKKGHETAWLIKDGVAIVNSKTYPYYYQDIAKQWEKAAKLKIGDEVVMEGRKYRLRKGGNDNVELVELGREWVRG